MDSTRPIRALTRGLDALTVLNLRGGATVSEIAHEIRLPRTTVHRILETLCGSGFVHRDADERYRLTIRVKELGGGFDDENWVARIAKPIIDELRAEIVWPVHIAALSGTKMMVREATDHDTPLALERYSAGVQLPLLTTSSGLVFLAHCPTAQRDALIEGLARSHNEDDRSARNGAALLRELADIHAQGFATATRTRRPADELTISVPVHADRLSAALTLRLPASAMPLKTGLERFLPKLRRSAAKISARFTEQQAGAHPPALSHATA